MGFTGTDVVYIVMDESPRNFLVGYYFWNSVFCKIARRLVRSRNNAINARKKHENVVYTTGGVFVP